MGCNDPGACKYFCVTSFNPISLIGVFHMESYTPRDGIIQSLIKQLALKPSDSDRWGICIIFCVVIAKHMAEFILKLR